MQLHRSARAAALAAGLLVGSAAVGTANPSATTAAATPAMPAAVAALPDSSALDTKPLVSGTVARPNGELMNGGYVVVYALPNQAVIEAAARPGGRYELTPVSQATIAVDGTFTARLAPTVDLSSNVIDGFVNLQAWAVAGDQLGSWGFSRTLSPSGQLLSEVGDSITAALPPPEGRLGPASAASSTPSFSAVAVTKGAPVVQIATQTTVRAPRATIQSAEASTAFGCRYVGPRYNNRRVGLGQIYHYRRGVNSRFGYRVGSTSSLGYAVKVVGSTAGWSQGGTATSSTSTITSFAWRSRLSKRVFRVGYDYGRFHCTMLPMAEWYQIQAISYAGGANSYPTYHKPRARHCTPYYEARSQEKVIRNKNIEFANGVSLGSIIGIDVSARSGYSTEVRNDFRFKVNGRRLCGSSANPVNTEGRAPGWIAIRG